MKSFLFGLGIGIGLGVLFAPMSGEETRNTLPVALFVSALANCGAT